MKGENGVPVTPEWTPPEPHAWDAERCCPPECIVLVGDNIELGDN